MLDLPGIVLLAFMKGGERLAANVQVKFPRRLSHSGEVVILTDVEFANPSTLHYWNYQSSCVPIF